MKHFKDFEVPAKIERRCTHTTCDRCGADVKAYKRPDTYKVDDVTIEHRTGTGYSECGHGSEHIIDLCGSCFATWLVPLLRSHGVTGRDEEWDF